MASTWNLCLHSIACEHTERSINSLINISQQIISCAIKMICATTLLAQTREGFKCFQMYIRALLTLISRREEINEDALDLSVCLSVCLSVFLFVCLSVCLSVCLFVCLLVCLSVCLSVCVASQKEADIQEWPLKRASRSMLSQVYVGSFFWDFCFSWRSWVASCRQDVAR